MAIVDFFIWILLIALTAAFIILLLTKVGIIEWLQVNGLKAKNDRLNDIVSKLANCHFCLSFWTGFILSVIVALLVSDCTLLCAPIFAAPITRFIL